MCHPDEHEVWLLKSPGSCFCSAWVLSGPCQPVSRHPDAVPGATLLPQLLNLMANLLDQQRWTPSPSAPASGSGTRRSRQLRTGKAAASGAAPEQAPPIFPGQLLWPVLELTVPCSTTLLSHMPPHSGISENYALARKIHVYHDLNSRAELYVVMIYYTQ